jgi:NDP-sugar pyrophosphorylase family protein
VCWDAVVAALAAVTHPLLSTAAKNHKNNPPKPKKKVVARNCLSAGEALRALDQKDIIKGDFVLLSADTVSNLDLAPALTAHRARREKDKNAIMTMVLRFDVL